MSEFNPTRYSMQYKKLNFSNQLDNLNNIVNLQLYNKGTELNK